MEITEQIIINVVYFVSAVVCAGLLSYAMTPPVRVLAFIIGAVDVPTDDRRMHIKPTPRIGGLAIFIGFAVSALVFGRLNSTLAAILIGGMILVILGIVDDVYRLGPWVKFFVQILASGVPIYFGIIIDHVTVFGKIIEFGVFSIPITMLWIVGITNAINFIDGLDGLACGVSGIMSLSILGVVLIHGDYGSALITAILAGACFGFLPFNTNPARIFMGDTGALFLGFTLSVLSVQGVFKLHTVLSFLIPIALFALPLLDAAFAIIRRLTRKESPFNGDRAHLHHKLVDLGFTQREAVRILYSVCGILGLVAIIFSEDIFSHHKVIRTFVVAAAAIIVFALNYFIMKRTSTRVLSGLTDHGYSPIKKDEPETSSPSRRTEKDTTAAGGEKGTAEKSETKNE